MTGFQLLFASLLVVVSAAGTQAADSLLGQKVFLRESAAPRVGTTPVDPGSIALPAAVESENGDWLWIGKAWVRRGDVLTIPQAIELYQQQTRQNPRDARAWSNLAGVRSANGDYGGAIKDIGQAIQLDPNNSDAYANRGWARAKMADYHQAIDDLTQALKLNPNNGLAWGNSAWIRATAYDKSFRNANKALANASKACELSGWKDWNDLDTLAAAYAENQKFAEAVRWINQALELAPASEKKALTQRLEQYQAEKPYREHPVIELPAPVDAESP